MSITHIKDFLTHEHDVFLNNALAEAQTAQAAACGTGGDAAVCDMWTGWVDYLTRLRDKNARMQSWTEGDFRDNLGEEITAIYALEGIIDGWLRSGDLDGQAIMPVRNLQTLLEIEREATEEMLAQLDVP